MQRYVIFTTYTIYNKNNDIMAKLAVERAFMEKV